MKALNGTVSLRLPKATIKQLKDIAYKDHRTISAVIQIIIEKALDHSIKNKN